MMKRRRFSRTQWQQWLAEHAESNQSIRQFCLDRDLPENSFYRWRNILSQDSPDGATDLPDPRSQFVQVEIASANIDRTIEIRLPCGAVVNSPADVATLRPLMQVLLQLSEPGERS